VEITATPAIRELAGDSYANLIRRPLIPRMIAVAMMPPMMTPIRKMPSRHRKHLEGTEAGRSSVSPDEVQSGADLEEEQRHPNEA